MKGDGMALNAVVRRFVDHVAEYLPQAPLRRRGRGQTV
jgi:hypothetical protein